MISLIQQTAGGGGAAGGFLNSLLLFGPLILIFYFLILRPQNKRMKAHKELVANVQRNDVVVTNGGIIGKVKKVSDEELTITSGTSEFKVARSMIADVRNPKAAAND
ncbi:preprotein translocase subunit YajC [Litorimonas sp. WD9-15]|uniref:preprotein translocase subunit YajC n=1 Tax=Litorimonas sp. WD9-15 TaxID=3418716 RepID=UPI003D048E8D